MTVLDELLPCPFCGGKAERARSWLSSPPKMFHCADAECMGHHSEQDEQGGYNHESYSLEDAAAKWNRRAAVKADDGQQRWKHKKRGSTYRVIGHARLQKATFGERAPHLSDMTEMVVYQSEKDGSLWVRSKAEFEDGRFEPLSAPPTTEDAG